MLSLGVVTDIRANRLPPPRVEIRPGQGFSAPEPAETLAVPVQAVPRPQILQTGNPQSQISFQVEVQNCVPWEVCTATPQLHFVAQEPGGFQILQVYIRIGDRERMYTGADALLSLPQTDERGLWIDYWAVSDHAGETSENFRFKYRYLPTAADPASFRFEILGLEWADQAPVGSILWGLFPPADQPLPKALDQPFSVAYLSTTNRYLYLAGHLIQSGVVDAKSCPDGGLLKNGTATQCGEKAGAQQVLDWQNKYDDQIYAAALKYNIPARVLKGILAQETQFWPASTNPYELGLGKMTENGADMLLTWNTNYFLALCLPVYERTACSAGYSGLSPSAQMMLRRAVLDKVGTAEEIDMLAASLLASATQVNRLVINTARKEPAELTTYEAMWKITVGNYYAGSGCTGSSLQKINDGGLRLTWEQVIAQMLGDCKNATVYVERVMGASQ